MAETVKLPVLGPVNRNWVYIGGALIVGIVGYAWWTRTRPSGAEEVLPEDIPQERQPPPTIVGTQDFDTGEVRAIINTNAEWYTSAVEYLVSTGGFDFTFATITLGKFLARRELTEQEANLVQAAKGAVGEPPQGGPWPIIRAGAPGPSTSPPVAPRMRIGAMQYKIIHAQTLNSVAGNFFAGNLSGLKFWNPRYMNRPGTYRVPAGTPFIVPRARYNELKAAGKVA
jgi:hypothetical protein